MIHVIVTLVILGLILYLVERFIPMSEPIRTVLRVVVVIVLCLWLLQTFGMMDTGYWNLRTR